ncbi:hypothetical protein JCM19046_2292 [Bacillus sp. JCM 19046]|uniref:Uncharacterized protein n=1 Tax=Shouchella xiaoxiensis TaxID=766895 RepID=A0ABS2SYY0_9BACI|nr:hypothetical protein [Shouchella xiaoxiensis]MBM7839970.1 hypothetical protein [Shouchella xiaoxiensis]GAF12670.1 hypothetical protein JCM19045_1879 [Bacillus sp. JCM 19045]GAF17765.1 hypothetical protein JCM19046_2292 [Bacillus sp. JCM 19046]
MEHSVRKSFGLTISALGLIQFILFLYLFLTQFSSEFMRSNWISDWRTTAFILPLFFFSNGLFIAFQKKPLSTQRLLFVLIFSLVLLVSLPLLWLTAIVITFPLDPTLRS